MTWPLLAQNDIGDSSRNLPRTGRYTLAAFYDGKLHGVDGLGRQEILGWASGL